MICYACPRSATQPRWRCKACRRDFSITSGTLFAWHKLREAMAFSTKALRIGGEVRVAEIDGAYFGGQVRPENRTADRLDWRLAENQSGKRQVVVVMREGAGRTLVQVAPAEAVAVPTIRQRVAKGTLLHADESTAWNTLHAGFAMRRINHQDGYSLDGACTNHAESHFSRLRRSELGHHHHIAGP
jgi:ISXO2-like transposase domain